MRLNLTVFLVTLALLCYEGNAEVCPASVSVLRNLVLGSDKAYRSTLENLGVPEDTIKASLEVKGWIDYLPFMRRSRIFNVVESLVAQCNV
ncbi:secretoglobin family 1D member 2-like [Pteronotus mesoamericanus]|uniref:secretoglobin family 1D member 2-like n=1 Tax=Pteronotus mesoamericanus TaxID=1884717 RepID=UPI0023ECD11C|nr:secretoglobin family 1D member 2-like [Pteronotus parnellii mesoamericanus]